MTGGTYQNSGGGFLLLNTNTNALTTNSSSTSAVLARRISLRGDNTFTIASGPCPAGRMPSSAANCSMTPRQLGLDQERPGEPGPPGPNSLTGFTTVNAGQITVAAAITAWAPGT